MTGAGGLQIRPDSPHFSKREKQQLRFLGIDPGINGGAAIIEREEGFPDEIVSAMDLPVMGEKAKKRIDVSHFQAWILKYRPKAAFIERAQAMPNQGASSGFLYGRAVGALEAVILCSGVPLELIESSTWKRKLNLKGKDKEASRQRVLMQFPKQGEGFARKKDHQKAEAVLIACYGASVWADRR